MISYSHYNSLPSRTKKRLKRTFKMNGCGSTKSWSKVPNFIFTANCNFHDLCYKLGGTRKDKIKADLGFYRAMYSDAIKLTKWWSVRRYMYVTISVIYLLGVLIFGGQFFNYGCHQDLIKEYEDLIKNGKEKIKEGQANH